MSSDNFAMMVRVRGDVSVEQVNAALRKIRARHPALIPAAASDQDAVFPLAVRADCGEDDWIEAAQAELGEPFPDRPGPFARFTLLKRAEGFDLVAAFHHHFSDGMSGMFVLRDVLSVLGDPDAVLVPLAAPPPTGALIPGAVLTNSRLRRKVAWTVFLLRARVLREKLRRRFFPGKRVDVLPAQETSAGNLSPERQFVILPARLTAAQTSALAARCKEEQVSVHAAVCVAWLRAFTAEMKGATRFGTVSSPVKYDFSITNLGRIVLPERSGDLQVEAFYGPLVNASPYERTVGVSTLGGQMSIVLLFRRSMMEPARGRELLERAVSCIKAVC